MSHQLDGSARPATSTKRLRFGLAVVLGLVVCLVAAPMAQAKFTLKRLHLGTTSGAADYLFTAGNTVVEQAQVDRGRYYRFDVYDPSGTVHQSSACRAAPHSGTVSSLYTIQAGDSLSTTTAWRFRLREFSSSSACASATSPANDGSLYFDVVAATSYSGSSLSTPKSVFGATGTAYVQVAGAGRVTTSPSNTAQPVGSWSTIWITPTGTTACANTANNAGDLAGSTAGGQLPNSTSLASPAQPSLMYRPSLTASGVDAWNQESNYETRPCQNFADSNQGQWTLLISRDSTHFVRVPAFSVNTTPPVTTLTNAPSKVTAATSATFQFTSSEAGSTFQCSLDGATPTDCGSPQTDTGLSDGAHTFSVTATDPAGNVDPTPATASWTVDTTAPDVTLGAPTPGSYTNNTTPTLSGTAETAAGDSAVTVDIYSGTDTSGTPVQSPTASVGDDGSWSIKPTGLPDGTYTAQARQTDEVSNTGYSEAATFTVDTVAPTVTLYSPADGTHTNNDTPNVSGSAGTAASDVPTVTVTVTGTGSPVTTTASVSPSGTWQVDLPQSLADGTYTVQAAQQDLAGNTGYATSHITVDTTPPQSFLDAAPVGVTSSTSATFAFHATDARSLSGTTFQCQLDGGAWGACTSPQTYFGLANGSHTFTVAATDGAGNQDPVGQTVTWTINTALPAITLQNPASGTDTNDTTPSFSGDAGTAAGDSSTVQLLIFASTDLSGSPVQTLTATAGSDGSWSATAAALPDGTYAAYAQQAGAAGTATSDVHTFAVDTHAPSTTITLGPPGDSGTGDASFSFSSSKPGSSFQCRLDGGAWSACSSPESYTGLGNGSHTFDVRSIDQAGNVGSAASQTWTVNTSLPALSLSSPSDGAVTNNPGLAIAGTGGVASGDADTVTVKIFSGTSISGSPLETLSTSVASVSGAWSTHPSPTLQDGIYTAYAQQDGSAGTAYTSAVSFTIRTTPPTTTITSGAQGTTSATSARFAFTSSEAGSTFQCQLDGGTWTACSSPESYSSLALGAHTFSVRATDRAGNVDPTPPVANWTIDTVANVPVTLTSPADGTVTSNTTPTFSGAASAADGDITVEIDDSNGSQVELLDVTAAGSWSVAASPALPDGTYTAFASQLGSDGVTTDYSATISFTVDTTPPAVTLTSGPSGTGNDTTPTFGGGAGTAPGDGSVTLDIYSGTSATGTPVQSIAATVSGSSWSATTAALADGNYTARAEQTDSAGNHGQSAKRTFAIDTVAPDTTITSAPPASTTATSASFSFSSSKPGSSFQCQLDGGAWGACTSPHSYPGLSVGAHSFAVRATDAYGDVDPTPATADWTITVPTTTPTTSTTPTPSPPTTGTTITVTLGAKARQRLTKHGQVKVQARCGQACSLLLSGKLAIVAKHHKTRTMTIRRLLSARLAPAKRVTLTIKLSARYRRAVIRALAHKQRVTLTVTGLASATALRSGSGRVSFRLVR
jgi:hypothetical protein